MDIRESCTAIDPTTKKYETAERHLQATNELSEVLASLPDYAEVNSVSCWSYSGPCVRVGWEFFHSYFGGVEVCNETDKRSNGFVLERVAVFVGRVKIEAEKYQKLDKKTKRLPKVAQ